MTPRPYQLKTVEMLYEWFDKNKSGNPVLSLPGGSGKSVIIAMIIMDIMKKWPNTRILALVHSMELVDQNHKKLKALWPNAPVGVYSAGLNKREIGNPITYAGIGSVAKKHEYLGHIDLVLVDECHAISHEETGNYRKLINNLKSINKNIRIIGLSASPYRLGHGMITDGDDAIFSDIIEPVSIVELIAKGYLCELRSKNTQMKLSTDGVHKRGGEFIQSELSAVCDTDLNNNQAVIETIKRANGRKGILVFCTSVQHAEHIRDIFIEQGESCECVSSNTPMAERKDILERFKAHKTRIVTNVGILTTGFDHPGIDCIVFLRPTASPGLYLQCAVRGSRPVYADGYDLSTKDGRLNAIKNSTKPDCLVLDFAGLVSTHGPITAIKPPKSKGNGDGVAPCKICPECDEMLAIQTLTCTACGFEFPKPEKKPESWQLRDDDIMGVDTTKTMHIDGWKWRVHTSRTSGKEMMKVTYYGKSGENVDEYLCIWHGDYAGAKALRVVEGMMEKAGYSKEIKNPEQFNEIPAPKKIRYKMEGKFPKILLREWSA